MKSNKIGHLGAARAAALLALSSCTLTANPADFLKPFPAHHVIANIYFVGTEGQADYLITTPEGNILINSGTEENPPMIRASIEKLGFKYSDTKILLISHAHTIMTQVAPRSSRKLAPSMRSWTVMCRWWNPAASLTSTMTTRSATVSIQ